MVSRPTSPTLIGREGEREELRAAMAAASAGTTTSVLLAGEAGIGKSRLVADTADLARADGFRVLIGGCVNAGEGGVPYGPIVDILRQLVQDLPAAEVDEIVGADRAALARLLPSLLAAGTDSDTARTDAAGVLDAIVATVARTARSTPTLLVIEDVHWADPGTRDALAHLVRRLRTDRLALLMTFRSDELHRRHPLLPWLADLQRSGRVVRIDVERLDSTTTRALVTALLGSAPPPGAVERIQQRSEGNPFFIEELVLAGGDGAASRLPPTLRDVLLARLTAIPDDAQIVIDAAAVVGRPVEHDLLATLTALDDAALGAAVRAAIDERLLVVAAAGSEDGYGFRHALLQEAAYDDLLPGDRQRWHRRVAEALAAEDAGQGAAEAGHWAELAHHWSAARVDDLAFAASIHAGTAASRAFAFVDARRHLERALGLWSSVPDPEAVAGDRVEVLRLAAQAAWLGGDSHRPVDLNREAVVALGPDPDPVAHAMALERLGRSLWSDGSSLEALEQTRKALAILPEEPPSAERARVLAGYGQLLMLVDRWAESIDVCEAAVAMARAVGAREAEGHALNTLGLDYAAAGRAEDSDRCLREAIAIAREVGNADDLGRGYTNWSEAKYYLGDWRGAAEVVREGIIECDRVGVSRTYGTFARENGIAIAFDLGEWDEARRYADDSFAMVQAGHQQAKYLLAHWTPFGAATGDPLVDERLVDLRSLLQVAKPEAQFDGRYGVAVCERATWQGDPATGLAVADAVLRDLADAEWTFFRIRLHRVAARAAADLAEQARARRDAATEASALATLAAQRATLDGILATERPRQHGQDGEQTDAEVATVDAEIGRAHGRSDADAWAAVATRWERRGNPYLQAYARWHEAEARIAAGDRTTATAVLAASLAIADRLGATPLADAVRSLATRSRLDLAVAPPAASMAATAGPAEPDADAFGLTRRERDVLPFLVQGRTNRQIAESLFISESTAGVHVSNILGKLGVTSRTEAAAIAVRLGLAD